MLPWRWADPRSPGPRSDRIAALGRNLVQDIGVCDREDDISSLSARVDIGMSLGRALQWIAAINDRLELAGLSQLCKIAKIFDAH